MESFRSQERHRGIPDYRGPCGCHINVYQCQFLKGKSSYALSEYARADEEANTEAEAIFAKLLKPLRDKLHAEGFTAQVADHTAYDRGARQREEEVRQRKASATVAKNQATRKMQSNQSAGGWTSSAGGFIVTSTASDSTTGITKQRINQRRQEQSGRGEEPSGSSDHLHTAGKKLGRKI